MNSRALFGIALLALSMFAAFSSANSQVLTNATVGNGASMLATPTPSPTPVPTPTPSPTATPFAQVFERQAPVYGSGNSGLTSLSTASLATPCPSGDLLVVEFFGAIASSSTLPTGAGTGWTNLYASSTGSIWRAGWYKTCTGSELSISIALTGTSFANARAIMVDLANTSGTPTYVQGSQTWSVANKTVSSPSISVSAGSYALAGFDLDSLQGAMAPGAALVATPLSNLTSETRENQNGSYPSYYSLFNWARGVYPAANGSATAELFEPNATELVYNTSTAAASMIVVAPGATLRPATPAPSPTAVVAQMADQFVDSIGVNTHFPYSFSAYSNYLATPAPNGLTTITALTHLGVRHIRDTASGYTSGQICTSFSSLVALGIDVDETSYITDSPSTWNNEYACMGGAMIGLEGSNEYNGNGAPNLADTGANYNNGCSGASPCTQASSNWQGNLYNEQVLMWNSRVDHGCSGTCIASSVHLLAAPLIGYVTNDFKTLEGYNPTTPYSNFVEIGNDHAYISSNPETLGNNPSQVDTSGAYPPYTSGIPGSYSAVLNWLGIDAPGKPDVTTEFGYADNNNNGSGNPSYFDQTTKLKYTLRTFLYGYQQGLIRQYLYELASVCNGNNGTACTTFQDQWSMMDIYLNPTSTYTALGNLIAIMTDKGLTGTGCRYPTCTFTTTPLSLAITSAYPDTSSLLFQKQDGSYYLILWKNYAGYDSSPAELADVSMPFTDDAATTITFGALPSTLTDYTFSTSTGAVTTTSLGAAASTTLTVTDMPQILEIGTTTQAPVTATPVPIVCPTGATPCPKP